MFVSRINIVYLLPGNRNLSKYNYSLYNIDDIFMKIEIIAKKRKNSKLVKKNINSLSENEGRITTLISTTGLTNLKLLFRKQFILITRHWPFSVAGKNI